jgi:hypothetical protein
VSLSISLDDVRQAATDYLLLGSEEVDAVDVIMAVDVANHHLDGDPVWLLLVGPPSTAKTELLSGLMEHGTARFISSLTPHTLVSGFSDDRGVNGSLLPRLTDKTLVVKDLTSLLTMRRESRAEVFSQLREIYDGHYSKSFGTGETISWTGKIGILAAVTPIIDRYLAHHQVLGERFLQYRLDCGDRVAVAQAALQNAMDADKHRYFFQWIVTQFLSSGFDRSTVRDDPRMDKKIGGLAILCAQARAGVVRNSYSRVVEMMPQAEGPGRLVKQLKLLGVGLALVRQKDRIDQGVYRILRKVARDNVPQLRYRILKGLWQLWRKHPKAWFEIRQIEQHVGVPGPTVRLELEDIQLVRLAECQRKGSGETAPQLWRPSRSCRKQAILTGFFS